MMLAFQRDIVQDLVIPSTSGGGEHRNESGDVLLVLGKGLGLTEVLLALLQVHADRKHLVLLLNTSAGEFQHLQDQLALLQLDHHSADPVDLPAGDPSLRQKCASTVAITSRFRNITAETTQKDRMAVYLEGGIIAVTSRILVVDLLTDKVPAHLVSGIIVNHAHQVTEFSNEAFILRLFREKNKEGFIKAVSDQPEMLTQGFARLEKAARWIHVQKILLWPRFHVDVAEQLEKHHIDLVEYHQALTPRMSGIQRAILDIVDACLQEVRRANPSLDMDILSVEQALFRSFDVQIRQQLEPIWHRVSYKTKQLVNDMRVLRKLLEYLIRYDCVTFLSFLETVIQGEYGSTGNGPNQQASVSPWLFMDAADTVFKLAKERVYNTDAEGQIELALEENPKWSLLRTVLKEIKEEVDTSTGDSGNAVVVLIMVADSRTIYLLRDYLSEEMESRESPTASSRSHCRLLRRAWENYKLLNRKLSDRAQVVEQPTERPHSNTTETPTEIPIPCEKRPPPPKRQRRARGGSASANSTGVKRGTASVAKTLDAQLQHLSDLIDDNGFPGEEDDYQASDENEQPALDLVAFNSFFGLIDPADSTLMIHIRSYDKEVKDRNAVVLEELKPRFIVLYDTQPFFIRQVECFRAKSPTMSLRVYFLLYANSVEEQVYLTSIRQEKDAFEKLIREKSVMALQKRSLTQPPIQAFMNIAQSRRATTGVADQHGQVLVDMREFRSSLPIMLHAAGYKVIPITLEVGDYVVTPDVALERKSLSDLVGSLNNGRLYSQAESLTLHYATPGLLIEFELNKAFSLQAKTDVKAEISQSSIVSKLVLLILHFPKLNLIWSSSPHASVEIISDLKQSQHEPDPEEAAKIGVDQLDGAVAQAQNFIPCDMLQRIPGVHARTKQSFVRHARSLFELSEMTQKEIAGINGNLEHANKIFRFFNDPVPLPRRKKRAH